MRTTGKLSIGKPVYALGVFSVSMLYINDRSQIYEDDIRSAEGEVRRQFLQLLHLNRFYTYGVPEVDVKSLAPHILEIIIGCQASRSRPEPIVIESMKG